MGCVHEKPAPVGPVVVSGNSEQFLKVSHTISFEVGTDVKSRFPDETVLP